MFPSDDEGFGLPAVEALACGTPVVACDLPALREVLDDRATFVAPDDLVALVVAGVARLPAGPARRAWTWDDAARATWAVYESALSRRRAGARLGPNRPPGLKFWRADADVRRRCSGAPPRSTPGRPRPAGQSTPPATRHAGHGRRFLTDILVGMGCVSRARIEEAVREAQMLGTSPERLLVEQGTISSNQMARGACRALRRRPPRPRRASRSTWRPPT